MRKSRGNRKQRGPQNQLADQGFLLCARSLSSPLLLPLLCRSPLARNRPRTLLKPLQKTQLLTPKQTLTPLAPLLLKAPKLLLLAPKPLVTLLLLVQKKLLLVQKTLLLRLKPKHRAKRRLKPRLTNQLSQHSLKRSGRYLRVPPFSYARCADLIGLQDCCSVLPNLETNHSPPARETGQNDAGLHAD